MSGKTLTTARAAVVSSPSGGVRNWPTTPHRRLARQPRRARPRVRRGRQSSSHAAACHPAPDSRPVLVHPGTQHLLDRGHVQSLGEEVVPGMTRGRRAQKLPSDGKRRPTGTSPSCRRPPTGTPQAPASAPTAAHVVVPCGRTSPGCRTGDPEDCSARAPRPSTAPRQSREGASLNEAPARVSPLERFSGSPCLGPGQWLTAWRIALDKPT